MRYLTAAWLASSGLLASEYHGTVTAMGLPLPGATVTAVQGDRRLVSTTDDHGAFSFPDLPDGVWTIEAGMVGFSSAAREVGVAPAAPATVWELKVLSEEALVASLGSPQQAASGTPAPPAAPQQAAVPGAPAKTARRAAASVSPQRSAFERLAVNQSALTADIGAEGSLQTEEIADLNQRAANSLVVQGSVSSALGLPMQNDWGLGGRGMGMELPGGPGMMGLAAGMGGNNGDGPSAAQTAPRVATAGGGPPGGGGPGGPGGFGGGPPGGGPGGPPGGGPGGGPGGPGGPGGFAGGPPGGPGGGPPPWQGRPNATAFGNGRRDPRNMYMASAFFSLDNSALDARTFSVTGASLDKPSYASARGGFMFGGPLQIPKLVSAQRHILLMLDLQFQRNRTGTTSQPVNMPTELERSGDFSQTLLQGTPVTIYDPTTGAPFPGDKIPASRLSATSLGLLQYFPKPNLPYAAQNYQTSWNGVNNSFNVNSRIANLRIGGKDRLSGGIGYQTGSSVTPNLFQFVDSGSTRAVNASVSWSRNINTRLTNNLQYTYSRNRQQSTPWFADKQNVAAELGIAGTSQDPMNWGAPNLNFANYGSLTDGNASLSRNQTSAVGDNLLWVRGLHHFTFGGDYRRQQFNPYGDNNGRGTYTFDGSATSYYVNGVSQSGTGYDLADFLLGLPATASIRYGNPDKYFRGSGYDLLINDDWRIAPRFSLVLGLRWDYGTPLTELYNRLVNLAAAPGFTSVTPVVPGQTSSYYGTLPNALIYPDRNNFSPRVGFAWRPSEKGSLVVRGGYGIYYNTSVYNTIANNLAQQPPYAQVLSASTSAANPLTIANGFLAASTLATTNTYGIDPNYRIGYAQTWNFTVQHDLPFSMFATIGYLGTKGTRLDQQFIPNSVAPGAAQSSLPNNFIYETSNGNSIYHAAQFQLNRRFHSGIMAHASYQFSKSIDDAGTGGRGQGNTPVAQDWLDLSAERALSSFDARHNLSLQLQYSTGMGAGGGTLLSGWKGALVKDWTISGNITVRSGTPLTATVGGNRSQVAGTAVSNTVRADATGLPVEASGMLFNTAAFTAPAAGEWGDAGRNTIPGPTTFSLDGSLGRIFRLGERRSADLQVQMQNALNHVTINSWGTVLDTSTYGLATGAGAMRKVTLSLRFRF